MFRPSTLWAGTLLALLLIPGCQRDDAGSQPSEARVEAIAEPQAVSRCPELGQGLLPASLLELRDHDQIQSVIDRCLTIDETTARAFALGYAEIEMGMQPPLQVRMVLPVADSQGTLIARQVILSSGQGSSEGFDELSAEISHEVRSAGSEGSQVTFGQVYQATTESYFTINVSAYLYRHPINHAQRGVPRWLAEQDDVRRRCPSDLEPQAILPAEGIPGAGRIVRYDCGGEPLLYSHDAQVIFAPAAVRTLHIPARTFTRWAERTSQGYNDPSARLAFLEGLWLRYLPVGFQP
jgi:hypothetical protein